MQITFKWSLIQISLYNIVHTVCVVAFAVLWMLALIDKTYRTETKLPTIFTSETILPSQFCMLSQSNLTLQIVQTVDPPIYKKLWSMNSHLHLGGKSVPDCTPFQSVAIIIPYRNRDSHLRLLLNRLHPMLKLQKIKYRIFVIEQNFPEDFNRGMLMNIGVIEALKIDSDFDCFIFHDVDLLPEHDMNIYMCDENLRGLAVAIDENRYYTTFENYAGGVAGINKKNFFKINGFPNLYWGWGNEDDDFSARTRMLGLKMSRPPAKIGRYKMVRHVKSVRPLSNYGMFASFRGRQMIDGLSSLTNDSYSVLSIEPSEYDLSKNYSKKSVHFLFTKITVNLNISIKALHYTTLGLITESEINILNQSQLNNKEVDWPLNTFESIRWFLHFYGWL